MNVTITPNTTKLLGESKPDILVKTGTSPVSGHPGTFAALYPTGNGTWDYQWFAKCRETLCVAYAVPLGYNPISTYLWSHNNPSEIYGLMQKVVDKNNSHSKMLIGFGTLSTIDEELPSQIQQLLDCIREFEEYVNLSPARTFITNSNHTDPRVKVFNVSNEWLKSTVLVSLYCLIIRCAVPYINKTKKVPFVNWLFSRPGFSSPLNDSFILSTVLKKIQLLKENGPDYKKLNNRYHNGQTYGVQSWGISACPESAFEGTKQEQGITQQA